MLVLREELLGACPKASVYDVDRVLGIVRKIAPRGGREDTLNNAYDIARRYPRIGELIMMMIKAKGQAVSDIIDAWEDAEKELDKTTFLC